LNSFITDAKKIGLTESEIHIFESNQSYVSDRYAVRIWNEGTPEWMSVDATYRQLNFNNTYNQCMGQIIDGRGNRQVNPGISVQDITDRDCCTGSALPRINKCGRDDPENGLDMAVMSLMSQTLNIFDPLSYFNSNQEFYKYLRFNHRMHPRAGYDGHTHTMQSDIGVPVFCHLDRNNPNKSPFNTILIASCNGVSQNSNNNLSVT
jgi:hypothetical protein